MRKAQITRKTKETEISLALSLDGAGKAEISTGVGFFDHMLELLTVHSGIDLVLSCKGDLQVDAHHTVEDCGIALGDAFRAALGPAGDGVRHFEFPAARQPTARIRAAVVPGSLYTPMPVNFKSNSPPIQFVSAAP